MRWISTLSRFYQKLLSMRQLHAEADHHVIGSADMELIIHAIPPPIAATFTITTPPEPREEQAIKLYFTVTRLADAAAVASGLGGAVFGPEYVGPGFAARNGYDPEGNIFQVRESR